MWFAGIDWADNHHDVVVIDAEGRKVAQLRIEHTPQGVTKLVNFLREIAPLDQIACIIETKHGLLITALLEARVPLYPVNPKTIDCRRVASRAKTDLIDAYLLAKHGRSELQDLRRLEPDSPIIAELKALTRDQDTLIKMQTRLVNQLTACLKAYYPIALTLFTKLQQKTTLAFLLTYPTLQAAQMATQEELCTVLKQAGHPMYKKVAASIFEALREPSLQADSITIKTRSRLMLALMAQLLPLVEQIAAYEKEIAQLFLTHPDSQIFESLPGASKRLAPRLLAEWGDDRKRYANPNSIQALAGTSPVPFESGNYAKVHQRLACIKPLRNAFYQFAWQSTQQEAWAKDYYERKRKQGKSHSMALRALANIWVRIVFAMWQRGETYQRETFEAARKHHAPRAA
ncbi:mini-circle putative transposase for IS117 [Ktedonobacter sp. SOSP1-52]|uniref:IS110 family transposase n=1 Tax=Ktedonobacter sp. SOSP1-52 TaxID=2778366 RepID=UPI0019162F6C|nr:IS110 family transposase [Ktedonobacter sp. SOSP1-52]GHO61343.1 mini-circle putative transposase for IS117 [Ktedonobacter sp. SOSP1-52]